MKHHIKQEFTSASTSQLNDVAKRGLTPIETIAKASAFQAKVLFVGMQLRATETLWAEAHNYSCDVLNPTATTSNRDKKSAYEMWHGVKPPPTLIQWFQPCFYRTKRKRKTDAQAKPGFYLGPALDHPRDTHRILSQESGLVYITRDVTWRHAPTQGPLSAQQTLPVPAEGGEDGDTAVKGLSLIHI